VAHQRSFSQFGVPGRKPLRNLGLQHQTRVGRGRGDFLRV